MKAASFTDALKGSAATLGHNTITKMSSQITENFSSAQPGLHIGYQSGILELDSILADSRKPPSVEDEVVSLLVSAMVGNIIERWDGEPCMKTVFHQDTSTNQKSEGDLNTQETSQEIEKNYPEVSVSATSSPSSKKQLVFSDNTSRCDKTSLMESADSLKTSEKRINSSNIDYPILEQNEQGESGHASELAVEEKTSEELKTWRLTELDQLATIAFVNGNHYQGRLSRNLMDGEGTFRWHDGSSYTGQFVSGNITGIGLLEWPNLDWYEGDFYCGYRHGYGQMVPASTHGVSYIGDWCLGKKHGNGAIFYQQYKDYYTGQWADGEKNGIGLRVYTSGTHYQGQWKNGVRHGQGTMVWANNDVYSGGWRDGMMDGYGEYTWNACNNKYFARPSENFYAGEWCNGLKHGNGLLKLASGVEVKGEWFEGIKHGLAYIFTSNGPYKVIFTDDRIAKVLGKRPSEHPRSICTVSHSRAARLASKTTQASKGSINSKASKDLGERVLHKSGDTHMEARQISVPVNWPSHRIQLDFYVERLKRHHKHFKRGYSTGKAHFVYPEEVSVAEFEKKWIENVVMRHLAELKMIYNRYAAICEDPNTFHFKPVLTRFLFWQFLRDCNFHKHNLSLGHIDFLMEKSPLTYIKNKYCPFENIYFWQFLHCLLELSWKLYSRRRKGVQTTPGQLASGLEKLIREDILPNIDNHTGGPPNTPAILVNTWREVEYCLDVCRATNGAHVEVYQSSKKLEDIVFDVTIPLNDDDPNIFSQSSEKPQDNGGEFIVKFTLQDKLRAYTLLRGTSIKLSSLQESGREVASRMNVRPVSHILPSCCKGECNSVFPEWKCLDCLALRISPRPTLGVYCKISSSVSSVA